MQIEDTERLRFELMGEQDAELLFELDQDPEVMRYLTGGKPTPREDIFTKALPRMRAYTDPQKGWGVWKVLLKERDDQFLGWVLIRPMHFFSDQRDDTTLEVGWRFMRQHWGNGYATEAARQISDGVLAGGNYAGIGAHAMEENTASISVMKRLGMTYENSYPYPDPKGETICVFYGRNNDKR